MSQRLCYDPLNRVFSTFGARPLAQGAPDALIRSSLTGQPLLTQTADGGAAHTFSDIEGRSVWASSAEGTLTIWHYEASLLPGRLLSVTEQAADAAEARVCQAYVWGSPEAAARNLVGAPVQVWDNAGVTTTQVISLSGVPLQVSRRLLANPADLADWRGDEAQCQTRLEPVDWALVMQAQADASGALISETNAQGVTTHTRYDISG